MSDDSPPSNERQRMRRAVRAVRREAVKASLVTATMYAALAALATTLVFRVLPLPETVLPATVPLPGALVSALSAVSGRPVSRPTVHVSMLLGVALGVVVFAAVLGWRLRRPLVEQFEGVNPAVSEALRTARDAVEDDADTEMARRLYEDVLSRLRESSSIGLVPIRRLAVVLVLVVALSVANVAVVASDVRVPVGGDDGGDGGGSDRPDDYGGLEEPDDVLGDATDVSTDGDDLNASIPTSGEGDGEGDVSAPSAYDSGGYGGGSVESQQAGFAEQERLEDADLIREYNLRIRETDDDQ